MSSNFHRNIFFPRTTALLNRLPTEFSPDHYHFKLFKARISCYFSVQYTQMFSTHNPLLGFVNSELRCKKNHFSFYCVRCADVKQWINTSNYYIVFIMYLRKILNYFVCKDSISFRVWYYHCNLIYSDKHSSLFCFLCAVIRHQGEQDVSYSLAQRMLGWVINTLPHRCAYCILSNFN